MSTEFPHPSPLEGALPRQDPRRVRRAVLAGVGEARNDPAAGAPPTDGLALGSAAALAAAEDLGSPDALGSVGLVAMTVGSDDAPDPAGALREALGLHSARTMVAAIGVPQQRLVSSAVLAVECGRVDAVLVVGSEARASAAAARRAGDDPAGVHDGPGADELLAPSGEFMGEAEVSAMLWDPVVQYALIDSALASAEGCTPAELRTDVSELWARFDAVAATNPDSCFADPQRSAEDLAATTEDNRLLAFPYNKWHSTQWAIDHAAALLICSEELALSHGADPARLLHPRVALNSSWGLTLSRRAELHRWPAMAVMGGVASEHLGVPLATIGQTELYSCFPAAVRVQQRELGLPPDGTPTVLGGMAFAGGPFNHFTYMATAGLARRLRSGSDGLAMLTTVSGLLTKGGLMVWGREPDPEGALVADLAAQVQQATGRVEVADFDPGSTAADADSVLAATITGGFDPSLFAICERGDGTRVVVSDAVPEGDPAEALGALLGG